MARISEKQESSDFLMVSEFYDRGYTVDEIAGQCALSMDTIIKLKHRIEYGHQEELKNNAVMVIYRAIDSLEKTYRRQIELQTQEQNKTADIKIMQGVERCLELKMKLLGLDGKQPFVAVEDKTGNPSDDIVLDLNSLSRQTIQELVKVTQIEGVNKSKITLKKEERMKEGNN